VSSDFGQITKKNISALNLTQLRDVLEDLFDQETRVPVLDTMMALLGQCKELIEEQTLEIASLRKPLFGRKSEQQPPLGQGDLFPELLSLAVTQAQ
jgi:hypothetical protein